MAVLILYLCLFCSLSIIRAEVRYMLVEEGAAVEMRVNKTHVNGSYNKWIKGKGSRGQMLRDYGGFIVDPSYIFSCVGSECLRIEKVTVKHADKYEYREMIEGNKLSTEFELLVGKLVCILKIGKQIVGENDCEGVQAEQVSRTCQLTLVGSKKYIPVIKWRAFKNGRQQQADRVVRAVNMTKDAGVNVWEVEDSVVVGREDTTFEAYVEGSSLNTFVSAPQDLIMYALNTTKPTSRMTYSNKHTRTCKAIKSSHVQCRYKWVLYHTDQQQRQTRTEFEGAKLRGEDIEKEGKYECHASCRLDTHPCTILADSFIFTGSQQASTYHWIIIPIILVLAILAAAFLLMMFYRRRTSRKSQKKEQVLKNTDDMLLTTTVTTTPITTPTTATTSTTKTTKTSTPLPQSRPGLLSSRRSSFKRSSSNKSLLMTKIAEEDPPDQKSMRITINDSRGEVKGVSVLGERIYVVCSDSRTLMVYHSQAPHNRLKPEEVTINNLCSPTHLTTNPSSLFISDYSDNHTVYRVYPKERRVCACKVQGNPASISWVGGERVVVVLKRNRKLHVEMYDSSCGVDAVDQDDVVWSRKQVFDLKHDVTLPLKACLSSDNVLCLLYASGRLRKNRFDKYFMMQYVLETGRSLERTCDLSDLKADLVAVSMEADQRRGGVCVLQSSPQPALWHLDHHMKQPSLLLSLPKHATTCFCLHQDTVFFGCSSSSHVFLLCKPILPLTSTSPV